MKTENKEKKKFNKKSLIFIIPIVVLSVVAVGLGIALTTSVVKANEYSAHLENQYQKSFYQIVDAMEDIEVDLSKVIVSTDVSSRKELLSEITILAGRMQSDLASLPIEHNTISETLRFANQLGGYCYAMKNTISETTPLTSEQEAQIESYFNSSKEIKTKLDELTLKVLNNYKIVDNVDFSKQEVSYFSEEWSILTDITSSVPSLIYDGPFSEAVLNKEIVGLPEATVTVDVATEILNGTITKVYDVKSVKYQNKSTGKFETYNFIVTLTDNTKLLTQVTVRGGLILSIDETSARILSSDTGLSDNEIKTIAQEFCANLGYDTMVPIYVTDMGNNAYVNLVPKINNTYIYPDMIKVKVEKTSGFVNGFEASSYAYNHTERGTENLTAEIGITQASAKLNSKLEIYSTKLTLIPKDYGGETLCYEFYCGWDNYEFYIYINAKTGEQENILRVVSTSEGALTL